MNVTRLPRTTRLFLVGNTVSMVGTGLVLPFLLIYLHQVRGIALPVVGALLAGVAVAGLIVVLNSLADDRIRGRANSISGFSMSLGFIASPAIITGFIATDAAAVWIVLLCILCVGTIGIGVTLGRKLTSEQNHVRTHAATLPDPAASERQERTVVGGRD